MGRIINIAGMMSRIRSAADGVQHRKLSATGPSNLGGVCMWYKSETVDALFPTDASPCYTWPESAADATSGKSLDVFSASNTVWPLVRKNVINGRSVLEFNARRFYRTAANSANQKLQSFTFWLAVSYVGTIADFSICVGGTDFRMQNTANTSPCFDRFVVHGDTLTATTQITTGRANIRRIGLRRQNGGNLSFWYNGAKVAETPATGTITYGSTSGIGFGLANATDAGANGGNNDGGSGSVTFTAANVGMELGEIIMANRACTDAEMIIMDNYLKGRWT